MGGAERGCGPACVYHREGRTTATPPVGIASIVEGILDDSLLVVTWVTLRPVLVARLGR